MLDNICQVCPLAKQTRTVFPHSSIKTCTACSLLHLDVWGPYKETTYDRCRFFFTIVDDYTRMTWIFLLQHKSDVIDVFRNFVIYLANQYKLSVQTVRTDNAPELSKGQLLQFYHSKEIQFQTSCVNTPQQNGIMEKEHRHILEIARSLFL